MAVAGRETLRLDFNQSQMLSPFYAINTHCREPKARACSKSSKELDCHLLSSAGFRGQNIPPLLNRKGPVLGVSEQTPVKGTLDLYRSSMLRNTFELFLSA